MPRGIIRLCPCGQARCKIDKYFRSRAYHTQSLPFQHPSHSLHLTSSKSNHLLALLLGFPYNNNLFPPAIPHPSPPHTLIHIHTHLSNHAHLKERPCSYLPTFFPLLPGWLNPATSCSFTAYSFTDYTYFFPDQSRAQKSRRSRHPRSCQGEREPG